MTQGVNIFPLYWFCEAFTHSMGESHMNGKLFSKNFLFLLIGQTLSMFGSNLIRFAISLYILETTESAALYGTVIAISHIPPIILSPFGGVLADRGDKKRWMVLLDGSYALVTFMMGIIFRRQGGFLLLSVLLIILSMLSSFEGPVSQTCIPLIQSRENLARANALSNQISSLSGLLSPILAGLLYGITGRDRIHVLMYVCAVCFLFAAGIELLLKIPKQELQSYDTVAETIKWDLIDIFRLVFREKTYIGETMLLNGLLTFLLMPYLSIGIPYLISIKLHLSAVWTGAAQTVAGIATILGGTAAMLISEKFQTKNLYWFLMVMGLSVFLLLPVLYGGIPEGVSFCIVCIANSAILLSANTAGVFIISGMQRACPQNMLGRLMALFGMCNQLTLPIGIWLHGLLYEKYEDNLYLVFAVIAVLTVLTALRGKKVYLRLQNGFS